MICLLINLHNFASIENCIKAKMLRKVDFYDKELISEAFEQNYGAAFKEHGSAYQKKSRAQLALTNEIRERFPLALKNKSSQKSRTLRTLIIV